MNLKQTIKVLEEHNRWRRDNNVPAKTKMADPKILGMALDRAIEELNKLLTPNVSNRFDPKYTPPFRVGRKQGKAILDANGIEVVFFHNSEEQAIMYCNYLNGC